MRQFAAFRRDRIPAGRLRSAYPLLLRGHSGRQRVTALPCADALDRCPQTSDRMACLARHVADRLPAGGQPGSRGASGARAIRRTLFGLGDISRPPADAGESPTAAGQMRILRRPRHASGQLVSHGDSAALAAARAACGRGTRCRRSPTHLRRPGRASARSAPQRLIHPHFLRTQRGRAASACTWHCRTARALAREPGVRDSKLISQACTPKRVHGCHELS